MDKRWAIGIDPGFGETGIVLVLVDGKRKPQHWATFRCPPKGDENLCRAVSLASEIVSLVVLWVEEHNIQRLSIGIETPIYNQNALAYEMQVRLLQEIESGLLHLVGAITKDCWLVEVPPGTSKLLATGSGRATKEDMVKAMPEEMQRMGQTRATKEALADAWGHSLAAWTEAGTAKLHLSSMRAAPVTTIFVGECDDNN